jgi:ribulose-bisphosphate carboxylase large chain
MRWAISNVDQRFYATYWLETGDDPARAAEVIAGEQSSGTFLKLAAETPELKMRSGAQVESLTILDTSTQPSLPGGTQSNIYTRCLLKLSWPLSNIGPCLPSVLSTVAGNLFELAQVSGLRLLDIELPEVFTKTYLGPAFGIEGTRRLSGKDTGPFIGTIIKPSVGLNAVETAEQVQMLVAGDIDFIKDDELQANGTYCPFEERVERVMQIVNRAADQSSKKVMVAFNITGDLDQMRHRHDFVLAHEGTCVMICLNSIGLAGVSAFRKHSQLPIHAHRAGWGYLNRSPALGWDFAAWQKIWRLAGVDHLHVNGLRNKFSESDESVIAAARSVNQPLYPSEPMTAVPVFSSAQTGLQAHDTIQAIGHSDLIVTAGGGIFGHPDGVAAGVRALRQAYEAAGAGITLARYSQEHSELKRALTFW